MQVLQLLVQRDQCPPLDKHTYYWHRDFRRSKLDLLQNNLIAKILKIDLNKYKYRLVVRDLVDRLDEGVRLGLLDPKKLEIFICDQEDLAKLRLFEDRAIQAFVKLLLAC